MKPAYLAFALMCIALTGCVSQTVTRKELVEAINQHALETVCEVHYVGSKDGFHYIAVMHTIGNSYYRISNSEFSISAPFPYTKDKAKWKALPSVPVSVFDSVIEPQSLYFNK